MGQRTTAGRALLVACGAGLACANPQLPADSVQTDARHVNRAGAWERDGRNVLDGFRNMYHPTVLQVNAAAYPFRML